MAEKSKALDRLAAGANKLLVKPLAQVVETDKSLVVRKRAAELLALQPATDANPALRKLLKSDKLKSAPPCSPRSCAVSRAAATNAASGAT